MLLIVVIVAIWGTHFHFLGLDSPFMLHYYCNTNSAQRHDICSRLFLISYFILLLPPSSLFCVPDVTPNRLSSYPAVALLTLLLRSRRIEPERAERAAAKE